jgi:tetratricopeptide (TPR) repeat protein
MSAPRGLLAVVVAGAMLARAPGARAQVPSASASASATTEPGVSAAELDAMLAPLGHDSVDERRAASVAIVALGAGATPAIGKKLADLRKGGDGGTYSAVKTAKERAGGGSGYDLLELLLTSRPDAAVTRALTTVALVRALAHAATTPAVRQMVLLASDAGGVLRPELGRQLKAMGDRAVAGLIEARRDPSAETRTWASNLLEGMGRRTPGDAVQTKDNQSLADVLHAYANIKDLDALPVVLSFVSSDRVQVRTAAREATLAYGQDAQWKLREAWAALMGEPAPDGIPAMDLAKKLYDAYDRARLKDVYELLDRGLAAQQEGKLKDAIVALDEVLARQPLLDRRAEAAPAYVAWGESLQDTDRAAALAALRKALRLDETGPGSSHVRSEIATLEGEDLVARGITDTEPFEQALALDPGNPRPRADLDRIHAQLDASRAKGWRLLAAAVVLVLAIVGVIVVGGRRKRAATA